MKAYDGLGGMNMEFNLIRDMFPDYLEEEELLNQKDKVTLYLKSRRTAAAW